MSTINITAIGSLAYFRGSDVFVTPAALAEIAKKHGRDLKIPALEDSPVQRAGRGAKNHRVAKIRVDVVNVDGAPAPSGKIPNEARSVVFGVLRREQVGNEEARWTQFDAVTYTQGTGWTTPSTNEGRAFVELAIKWQTHLTYAFVRNSVVFDALRTMGAFPVGGSGVMYVAGAVMPEFKALQGFVNEIPGCKLHGIKVDPTDPDSVSAVGDAAKEALAAEVAEVLERLATWREKAHGRASTLDTLMGELQAIRDRAAGLATGLRFSLDEIEAAVAGAASDVAEAIAAASAPAAFEAAPKRAPKAAKLSDDALMAELVRRGLVPAAPVVAPIAAAAPAAPAIVETVVVPDADEIGGTEIPSVEALETMSTPALRAVAQRLGVPKWGTTSPTKLVSAILALREQRANA